MSKEEKFLIKSISFVAAAISLIFTLLMFMNLADSPLSTTIYIAAGALIEGGKWFSLVTALKNYKSKMFGQVTFFGISFIVLLAVSIFASVSFSIYTCQHMMYDSKTISNPAYSQLSDRVNVIKSDIDTLKKQEQTTIDQLNSQIAQLPADYVSIRNGLQGRIQDTTKDYEEQVSKKQAELIQTQDELNKSGEAKKEVKTLKINSMTGLFTSLSELTKTSVDTLIIVFAAVLGVLLDFITVLFTYQKSFSYTGVQEARKEATKTKNNLAIAQKVKLRLSAVKSNDTTEKKPKVTESRTNNSTPDVYPSNEENQITFYKLDTNPQPK